MSGLSRHTLRMLGETEHLVQSIEDILTTPVGTRVLRRAYGSDIPSLIDRPQNTETIVDVVMATAEALERWEPRVDVARVEITDARAGYMAMAIQLDVQGIVQAIPLEIGEAA